MRNIEVKILNPESIKQAEQMCICAARLTQRGPEIKSLQDFIDLYNTPYKNSTLENIINLPHSTLQKFTLITVVVVGASRRFLAQITRHQNEVKFMSTSLQYSDYSDSNDFVIPYEILDTNLERMYSNMCKNDMQQYKVLNNCAGRDVAGYVSPQGLRNTIIISATPFQWKHMISQRVCRRNTDETRYILLKIWEQLFNISPILFSAKTTGPSCIKFHCEEGKMSCGKCVKAQSPIEILKEDFPKLVNDEKI